MAFQSFFDSGVGRGLICTCVMVSQTPVCVQFLNFCGLARQCSKRGGDLLLVMHPNSRMEIAGHAKIITHGKLVL